MRNQSNHHALKHGAIAVSAIVAGIVFASLLPAVFGLPIGLGCALAGLASMATRGSRAPVSKVTKSGLLEESVRVFLANQEMSVAFNQSLRLIAKRLGAVAGYVMVLRDDAMDEDGLSTEAVFSEATSFEFPSHVDLRSDLSGVALCLGRPQCRSVEGEDRIVADGRMFPAKAAICVPIRVESPKGKGEESAYVGTVTLLFSESYEIDKEMEETLCEFAAILGMAIAPGWHRRNIQDTLASTLELLVNMFEQRSEFTDGHSKRVSEIAVQLGRKFGLTAESLQDLRLGALLHDVGKIAIPESILNKPGKLTAEEYEVIRQHPIIGYEMCLPLKLPECVLKIIRNHHENLDGTGYPDGLSSSELSLFHRIAAVADSFDAMCSRRAYRGQMELDHILAELTKHAGTQFDPVVVEKLKDSMDEDWLRHLYSFSSKFNKETAA